MISEQASEDANIIWGAAFDENMDDEMSVTVIATGFATHDGSIPDESDTFEDNNLNVLNGTFGSKTASAKKTSAAASAPGKPAPVPETPAASDDEDDTFVDIMSIFNRNK